MKTNYKILNVLAFLLIVFAVQNCYYDEYLPETEIIDPGTDITFSGDLIPLFNNSCNTAGCHAAGDVSPDLSSGNAYDSLINGGYINIDVPEESELYQWMIGNRNLNMPLTGPNAEANAKVLAWITQGALNN